MVLIEKLFYTEKVAYLAHGGFIIHCQDIIVSIQHIQFSDLEMRRVFFRISIVLIYYLVMRKNRILLKPLLGV